MNTLTRSGLHRAAAAAAGILLAVVVGCGERQPAAEATTAAAPAPAMQGELISAPVVAPAPDPAPATELNAATPSAETPATVATTEPAATVPAGTPAQPLMVAFDKLAGFAYTVPDGPVDTNQVAGASSQIPGPVRALDHQFVSLKGFMLPLKVEKGLVTELLLMRDQSMCCYGVVPKINEWVSVKMTSGGVKPVMDTAVTLHGTLKVGEIYEGGYLVGIYEMAGERMSDALDM